MTPGSRSCILLVEDNPDDVSIAVSALRQHAPSHEIIVVSDGEEARDFLNAVGQFADRAVCELPDLVLLDMKLPKVGGMDVLRSMRADERTRAVPVVVLTSSNEEEDVLKAYRGGANSFIRKPVNFDKFAQTIREVTRYWLAINHPPPKT